MKTLKIAVLHVNDLNNKLVWSGIPHFIKKELEDTGHTVSVLKPLPHFIYNPIKVYFKIKELISGKLYLNFMNSVLSRAASWWFKRQNIEQFDLLIAPAGSSSIAYLKSKCPIIYATDGTFLNNANYYTNFTNLHLKAFADSNKIEQLALKRAAKVTVPSKWAYDSVIYDYGIDPSKVVIAEYGANMDVTPTREQALNRDYSTKELKLLFVGRGWEKKGGDIAYNTFKILRDRGLSVTMTFVGSTPPYNIEDEHLKVIPLLDKNDPKQAETLSNLYLESHFHFLPTRTECFGIVFSEASAHGLPSISTDTGGVPHAVRNGENGYRLPLTATPEEFADLVQKLWEDKEGYRKLVISTRDTYESVLNWSAWRQKSLTGFE